MAFYLEYPNRKLPSGLSPIHQTEVPTVEDAAREFAQSVAVAADQLSPTSAAQCLSPRTAMQEPPQLPFQTSPIQLTKKRSKSKKKAYKIQMRSQSFSGQHPVQNHESTPTATEQEQLESILYPTRAILSPRPNNQSKRVKWPDIEAPTRNSTPKVEQPEVQANAALDDLWESLTALGACCGPVGMTTPATSTSDAMSGLQSQLETVYEVERSPVRGNLTVRTNLPMRKEPISTPLAKDPILSFREKKNINDEDSISRGSDVESRDDISSSDGEDWAPVVRPRWHPQRPSLDNEIYHSGLRESASMRDDAREEQAEQFCQQKGYSHLTPRSKQIIKEIELDRTPREKTKWSPRNSSRRSSSSVNSGTSWNLPVAPRQSRRARSISSNKSSGRKKKSGFRLCGQKHHDVGEPHFAEIDWKFAPRVEENPFQQGEKKRTVVVPASPRGAQSRDGSMATESTQSQASSHISEIDWRTNQGKKVAALKLMQESMKEGEEEETRDIYTSLQVQQKRSNFFGEAEPRYVRTSRQPKQAGSTRGGDGIHSSKGSRKSDTRSEPVEFVI